MLSSEELELRECKVDHQVLVTTLRNHRERPVVPR